MKRVEELKFYGRPIAGIVDAMPPILKMKVGGVIVGSVIRKTGFVGFLPFMSRVISEKRRLINAYPRAYREASRLGRSPADQFLTMISLFNIVAKQEGRENAYAFTSGMFKNYSKYTIPALYDLENLKRCDGSLFENYKRYNIALFEATDDYHVKEIKDEPLCLTLIVDRCVSVEIARAFDCPEVGMLGCDHDLAGYPLIENEVGSEFRRHHTIAKGDAYCDFMFFKKGSAPDDEQENK